MNPSIGFDTIAQATGIAAALGFGYILMVMLPSQIKMQRRVLAMAEGLVDKQDKLHEKEVELLEENHERETALIKQEFQDDLEDLRGKTKNLEERLKDLQAIKEEQTKQIADLKKALEEKGRLIDGLKKELEQKDRLIKSLTDDLGAEKAARIKSDEEVKELRVRIRAMEAKANGEKK